MLSTEIMRTASCLLRREGVISKSSLPSQYHLNAANTRRRTTGAGFIEMKKARLKFTLDPSCDDACCQ